MSETRFIQIHTLASYPGTLLNRDDAGFAKRLPFGGATRTRVSSQCLKYHWRNFQGEDAINDLSAGRSIRSRETFVRKVAQPLVDDGYPDRLVRAGTLALKQLLLTGKPASKTDLAKALADDGADDLLETSQITVLGSPEVEYIKQLVREVADDLRADAPEFWTEGSPGKQALDRAIEAFGKFNSGDLKRNLAALKNAAGLDAAMFGRMVTSDILARGDAAIHVAHAITTHAEESESDYFSAVDELRRDEPEESGELGAGHINTQELTSGLFYGYVVVDVPLLIANISGGYDKVEEENRLLAADVLSRLVKLIATVSPGAKLGSTAPHSYAQFVFIEAGKSQPRTLANAFQKPVRPGTKGLLANSYDAIARFVVETDAMYGVTTERKLAGVSVTPDLIEKLRVDGASSIADLCDWVAARVGEA